MLGRVVEDRTVAEAAGKLDRHIEDSPEAAVVHIPGVDGADSWAHRIEDLNDLVGKAAAVTLCWEVVEILKAVGHSRALVVEMGIPASVVVRILVVWAAEDPADIRYMCQVVEGLLSESYPEGLTPILGQAVVRRSCHVELSSDLGSDRADGVSNPRMSCSWSLFAVDIQGVSELLFRILAHYPPELSVVVGGLHIVVHLGSLVSSSIFSSPARSSLLPLISCVFFAYCSISSFVNTLNTIT